MADKAGPSSIKQTSSNRWRMAKEKSKPHLLNESAFSTVVTKSVESSENYKLEGETDFEKVKAIMDRIKKKQNVIGANARMDKKIVLTFDSSRGRAMEEEEAKAPGPDGQKQINKHKKSKRVIHVKTRGTITEPPTVIINTGTDAESPFQPSVKIGTPAIITTNKHVSAIPQTLDTEALTERKTSADMAISTVAPPEKVDMYTETTDHEIPILTRTVGVGESITVTTRGVGDSIKVKDRFVSTENVKVFDVMTNTEHTKPLLKDTGVDAIPRMEDKELCTRVETKTRGSTANYKPEQLSKFADTDDLFELRETGITTDCNPVKATATMTYLTTYREKGQTANIPDTGMRQRVETLKKEIKVLYEYKNKMEDAVDNMNVTKSESESESTSECSFTDVYCQCCAHECGIREYRLCERCRVAYRHQQVDVSVRSNYRIDNPPSVHTLLAVREEREVAPLRIQIPPKGRAVRVRTPSTHADGEYRYIQLF